MGRANVYLPDDLERRIKAAAVPISEVCQRALLAAVEAAEATTGPFAAAVTAQFRRGLAAGAGWAHSASASQLFALLRDQRFAEIPAEAMPHDLYALAGDESLGWEAGFAQGARVAASMLAGRIESSPVAEQPAEPVSEPASESTRLGDDSGCQIGLTLDDEPVSFDPHAALREGKSPLHAILGEADPRARFVFSIAQDAAARGTAVVVLDLSGQLSARATGLGKNVRLLRNQATMPQLDDLVKGAVGLGGLWQTVTNLSAGAGLLGMFNQPADKLAEPGYVTVLNLSGSNALATALSAAQGLGGLIGSSDFPLLLQVDLPSGVSIPGAVTGRLGQIIRTARERQVAIGLSAGSADSVAAVAGNGAPLSTVFALPTSSPAEADRLRSLMGVDAPILLNAPGFSPSATDETWAAMRDLQGRLGQVRIAGA
jgi:hypothetical protein